MGLTSGSGEPRQSQLDASRFTTHDLDVRSSQANLSDEGVFSTIRSSMDMSHGTAANGFPRASPQAMSSRKTAIMQEVSSLSANPLSGRRGVTVGTPPVVVGRGWNMHAVNESGGYVL